jgi:hypothetical protein
MQVLLECCYIWMESSQWENWNHLFCHNSRFGDFVDRIYPIVLEIKDTTDTDTSASYLDLHLEIDSEGRLRTLYKGCLIRIKEQVGEKFSTVCTHRYADSLLKNTSTVLGRDRPYFVKKKNTLILPISSLKLISSTCSSFWLTTYLLSLVDVFFNRLSAYLWVQTVLNFLNYFVPLDLCIPNRE